MTDEAIKELQDKHGKIYHLAATLDGETCEVVVKRPGRAEFKRFLADCAKEGASRPEEQEEFLLRHIVSDKAAWSAMVDDWPGLVETFSSKLVQLCGFGAEVQAKKY